MTTEPEYPIVSTNDLKVGQQYRHGPYSDWHISNGLWSAGPQWVEAKPAPIQPGDRVRYVVTEWAASYDVGTVKYVGEKWLVVQVDFGGGDYEDVWPVKDAERIEADQ